MHAATPLFDHMGHGIWPLHDFVVNASRRRPSIHWARGDQLQDATRFHPRTRF